MKCDTLNEKNVRVCEFGQVYSLHPPSRSVQLPLSGREIEKQDNYKPTTGASQLLKSVTQKKCEDGGHVLMSICAIWSEYLNQASDHSWTNWDSL